MDLFFLEMKSNFSIKEPFKYMRPRIAQATSSVKMLFAKEAKSIFSGLIKVDEEAQHTDAYQTNRNLLLSSEAEADSLPGLEILANEVKCSHGATTSRIDPQELFYLHSRGIPKVEAEKLIAIGFLSESLLNIDDEETRETALNALADAFSS